MQATGTNRHCSERADVGVSPSPSSPVESESLGMTVVRICLAIARCTSRTGLHANANMPVGAGALTRATGASSASISAMRRFAEVKRRLRLLRWLEVVETGVLCSSSSLEPEGVSTCVSENSRPSNRLETGNGSGGRTCKPRLSSPNFFLSLEGQE